jgi:hypothetical protein
MDYEITELLYATDFMVNGAVAWGNIYSYSFQIDKNGNIIVKCGYNYYDGPQPHPIKLLFEIIDNIKIPGYIIELYKYIIKTHLAPNTHINPPGKCACRLEKMELFFEIVKNLKKSIKNIVDNPQNVVDIHQQIDFFKNKNIILEVELQKMNTKIENIQKVYFDTLNDNKILNDENKLLKKKIQELEIDVKKQKTRTVCIEVDNPTTFAQQNINSINTGTLPNATNKFTGIYKPKED